MSDNFFIKNKTAIIVTALTAFSAAGAYYYYTQQQETGSVNRSDKSIIKILHQPRKRARSQRNQSLLQNQLLLLKMINLLPVLNIQPIHKDYQH